MSEPEDILEINGKRVGGPDPPKVKTSQPARRFLSVWYRCCHTYGRMYRNQQQTAYEGACPKCGCRVRARIGHNGTAQRIFEAR